MFDEKVYDKTVKGHYVEIEVGYEEEDPEETIGKIYLREKDSIEN